MSARALASDAEVRRVAAEVLSREEYVRFRVEEHPLALLAERVLRWLAELGDWSVELSTTSPLLWWTILLGLLGLALALLAHVAWAVRAALRAPPPPAPRRAAPERAPDLVARAEALADAGRHLEAAHQLQLAALELLLRGGFVELDRSEPNRTLRARLRRAPLPEAERRELLALLDRLEALWFRDRAEDPAHYRAWRGLVERLHALPEPA